MPRGVRLAVLQDQSGRRIAVIRLALAMIILIALPAVSWACSCIEPPPPLEALKDATAVFSGRVLTAAPDAANGFTYTMRVHAVWKGSTKPEAEVTTSDVAMCGLWMEPGMEFLVYAGGEESSLSTHSCSRSKPLVSAEADLAELGAPIAVGSGVAGMTTLKVRYERDGD
jgi:hypothetical protein